MPQPLSANRKAKPDDCWFDGNHVEERMSRCQAQSPFQKCWFRGVVRTGFLLSPSPANRNAVVPVSKHFAQDEKAPHCYAIKKSDGELVLAWSYVDP